MKKWYFSEASGSGIELSSLFDDADMTVRNAVAEERLSCERRGFSTTAVIPTAAGFIPEIVMDRLRSDT
jgi:hypothetical protein